MWPFKPKESIPKWMYLGWTEIAYTNGDDKRTNTVHFYARGAGLKERRYEYINKNIKYDDWKHHPYIQQYVLPWSEGNNLWGPIKHPSDVFKEWTRENEGWVWKGDWWHKPAQHVEGNVFKFPHQKG